MARSTTDGPFWEERLVRPIDIYPEYRDQKLWEGGTQVDDRHLKINADFLEIHTDDGVDRHGRADLGGGLASRS